MLCKFVAANECGHEVVGLPAACAPCVSIATGIASLYEQQVDELQVIEVFTARDTNLAHELGISFMGGNQFFSPSDD